MFEITSTFRTLYDGEVIQQFRDAERLKGKTKEKSCEKGSEIKFRINGYGIATQHVSGKDVAVMGSGMTSVPLTLTGWDAFDYVDDLDDGQNELSNAQELGKIAALALGTRADQIRIDALNNGFDSVKMTVGSDTAVLVMDTLTTAQSKLNMNDTPYENRVFVYHPMALDGLMKDEKFTSSDYLSDKKQLEAVRAGTGNVALGFEFVPIAPRPNPNGVEFGLPTRGTAPNKGCSNFVFQKDAIGYGYNRNPSTKIEWSVDKQAWLVGGKLLAGATCLMQKWICEVKCKI